MGKRAPRAGVSRWGLRPQEAGAARLPPTRPERQRPWSGDACSVWKGRRASWYPYADTAGRDASGPRAIRGARHVRCRMSGPPPVHGASRSHAWRGKEMS